MAVQKSRKSRSKIGMRRSHDALSNPTLSIDAVSGEVHRRHHITAEGFYRGKSIERYSLQANSYQQADQDFSEEDKFEA